MPKNVRAANARAAAQSYAPRPNGSTITYGLIAAALLLVAAIIAGAFYRVDVVSNPLPLVGATLLAFLVGASLRLWRRREHEQAFDAEYTRRTPTTAPPADIAGQAPAPAAPDASPPVVADSPNTVTFDSPFLLPGLDRPHPAGTFQVRERREPLDMSFNAAVVTKTIMLTGDGSTEALDVKADDLAEALRRDAVAGR